MLKAGVINFYLDGVYKLDNVNHKDVTLNGEYVICWDKSSESYYTMIEGKRFKITNSFMRNGIHRHTKPFRLLNESEIKLNNEREGLSSKELPWI